MYRKSEYLKAKNYLLLKRYFRTDCENNQFFKLNGFGFWGRQQNYLGCIEHLANFDLILQQQLFNFVNKGNVTIYQQIFPMSLLK